jgi:hypothetical protein
MRCKNVADYYASSCLYYSPSHTSPLPLCQKIKFGRGIHLHLIRCALLRRCAWYGLFLLYRHLVTKMGGVHVMASPPGSAPGVTQQQASRHHSHSSDGCGITCRRRRSVHGGRDSNTKARDSMSRTTAVRLYIEYSGHRTYGCVPARRQGGLRELGNEN